MLDNRFVFDLINSVNLMLVFFILQRNVFFRFPEVWFPIALVLLAILGCWKRTRQFRKEGKPLSIQKEEAGLYILETLQKIGFIISIGIIYFSLHRNYSQMKTLIRIFVLFLALQSFTISEVSACGEKGGGSCSSGGGSCGGPSGGGGKGGGNCGGGSGGGSGGGNCSRGDGRCPSGDKSCSGGKCPGNTCKGNNCNTNEKEAHSCDLQACLSDVCAAGWAACTASMIATSGTCPSGQCKAASCVVGAIAAGWQTYTHADDCKCQRGKQLAPNRRYICVCEPENVICDAAANIWYDGAYRTYFFRQGEYARHSGQSDHMVDPGYPMNISKNWPGIWEDGIQAVFQTPNHKVYFFRGSQYRRYDLVQDQVDFTLDIATGWKGLHDVGWDSDIDAAFVAPHRWEEKYSYTSTKIFFFRGSEYVRYNLEEDKVDPGFPKSIAGNWPGLWEDGNIRGIISDEHDGYVYFLRDQDYLKYDIAEDDTVSGYPKNIGDGNPNRFFSFFGFPF